MRSRRTRAESKELNKLGLESDQSQMVGGHAKRNSPRWAKAEGLRLSFYSRSLGLLMGLIFALSVLAQAITAQVASDEEQLANLQARIGWGSYVVSAEFWNRTLQNWQSEFLAVASMLLLSIYLRQRGSPESKPVGAPHTATGFQG